MHSYDELDVRVEDDVFRIAFDNPDRQNAMTSGAHEELTTVFADAGASDASVVLLTGNGDTFSSGGDVEWLKECLDDPERFHRALRADRTTIRHLLEVDQPIVTRINGYSTGLATTLALFSDVTIASTDAKISDPHVHIGLTAGDGGAVMWPLLTGLNTAKKLLMTGEFVSGEEAADLGLVTEAVPPDALDERVEELIDRLASGSQPAIQYTKRVLNSWIEFAMNLNFSQGQGFEAVTQQHPDHAEAVRAFLEGGEARFPSASRPEE
jgi:enoyl-CoA hydratase